MNNELVQEHACVENKISIALKNLKNIEKYLKDHDKQMKLNYPDGQPEPSYEIVLLENAKKSLKQFFELENAIESGELVPVVHGRWIDSDKHNGFLVCSECKNCYIDPLWLNDPKWRYCPNCSAKMDLEEEK